MQYILFHNKFCCLSFLVSDSLSIFKMIAQYSTLTSLPLLVSDPNWVESLNTVLDENKRLCLTSGEIIQMNPRQSVLFETGDLEHASPATVGRCAILYQDPAQLGVEPLLEAWLRHHLPAALQGGPLATPENLTPAQQLMQRLSVAPGSASAAATATPGTPSAAPSEFVVLVRALLAWLVKPLVQHVTRGCTQLEPLGAQQLTLSFLRLYERLLSDEYKRVGVEDVEMPAAAGSTGDPAATSPSKQTTSVGGAKSAGTKSAKAGGAGGGASRQQTSATGEDGSQMSDPQGTESLLMSPEKIREEQANLIVAQFFFCLVWGIGGALQESSLQRFEEFFRILCDADPQNPKFPRYQ